MAGTGWGGFFILENLLQWQLMASRSLKRPLGNIVLLFICLNVGPVQALPYTFTKIPDSTTQGITGFSGAPAINNGGTVVFFAGLQGGGSGIFTGSGGQISRILDTSGGIATLSFDPKINDAGLVVVRGDLSAGGHAIFAATQGTSQTIAQTNGLFSDLFGSSVNNADTVAFHAARSERGSGSLIIPLLLNSLNEELPQCTPG